ncbi:hypothetical protein N8I77_010222 [Diaporthe amygdali]|uniref:Regulator of G protein signaling superfamily n=1 Tax=Phomopsis amygdali TaxID=1214568 RepID=A0AAD9S6H0_PHOAM|nr:hypothetical protein N8I77_010222 [Diaporthe amygdali]
MGFLGLGYRRPARVDHHRESIDTIDDSIRSGRSGASAGVPEALTFDKIIEGGTCPPCTIRDFMNYLIYVELSAENLQFFLWHRDYVQRFNSAKTSDIALAPEWTQEEQNETFTKLQKEHREGLKRDPAATAAIFKGTDFEKAGVMSPTAMDKPSPIFSSNNPFNTPPRTPNGDAMSDFTAQNAMTYRSQAQEAFASVGAKAPFTIQPFREEIDRVIATYVMDDAPRQLNLSARERKQLLIALSHTTHPTAFRQVSRSVESTLRMQAHPNFIRWSICNGNTARVKFANLLGAFLIVGSIAAWILLTLSSVPRGFRAIPAVGFVLGVSTQVAAIKGMCVVLHGMHHRHVRPWELFVDEEMLDDMSADGKSAHYSKKSFESFGSSNSYEDEPWVIKYEKRNLVRKVFDREVWIQEPALRSIQDTIFVQAMLVALLSAGALTAVFVCVPGGHFY